MANLLGLLEQFDPAIHEWSVYYNRLQIYLTANEIGDERKVAVVLALLGHKAYSTLQDLCMPDLPATKTLADLKTIMDRHFGPKVNIRAARTTFRATTQKKDKRWQTSSRLFDTVQSTASLLHSWKTTCSINSLQVCETRRSSRGCVRPTTSTSERHARRRV